MPATFPHTHTRYYNILHGDFNDFQFFGLFELQSWVIFTFCYTMAEELGLNPSNKASTPDEQPNKDSFTRLSAQQLQAIDFSRLPLPERQLLQRLGKFSSHNRLYSILSSEFGSYRQKQYFITENAAFLTADEMVLYTRNRDYFKQRSILIPPLIVGTCTVGSFIFALWTLPTRMSTLKYTLGGLAGGVVLAFGFWRYSMMTYYDTLNGLFRTVTSEKYRVNKK